GADDMDLPSYGDVLGDGGTSAPSHARLNQLGNRSTVRMGMSTAVIQGSTDEFNLMSHNVDARGRNGAVEAME
ncbi:hypothetical protein SARC_14415, partial [Sphaeroforma arctica JP610]